MKTNHIESDILTPQQLLTTHIQHATGVISVPLTANETKYNAL